MTEHTSVSMTSELLDVLARQGVRIWADQGRLKFDAPHGLVDDELRQRMSTHKDALLRALEHRLEVDRFPLTTMQAAYWVGETGALPLSTSARYYFELSLRAFPEGNLQRALHVLIGRHELLRSTIDQSGEIRMTSRAPALIPLEHPTLPGDGHTTRDTVRSVMLARRRRCEDWPPLEVEMSRDAVGVCLHFDVALWVFDGVSLRAFLHELLSLLAAPHTLLPPLPSYGEYQRGRALRRVRGKRLDWSYWHARVEHFPTAPSLPLARAANELALPRFRRCSFHVDAGRVRALTEIARTVGVSTSFVFLNAYAEVLQRFSRSGHFAITVLHSDRTAEVAAKGQVLGNFSEVVLLEVHWTGKESFATRAQALQSRFWQDIEAGISGVDVSRELSKRRHTLGEATFPLTFTLVPALLPEQDAFSATLDHRRCHLSVPQVHLDHQVCEEPDGGFTVNWDFVDGLFADGLIDSMFPAYERRIATLAADAALWHSELPARLCPNPPVAVAAQAGEQFGLLHEDFLRQATLHPEYFAVITPERMLRYGTLRDLAGRLALDLENAGVAAGDLVAVVMDKGWEQIVAVLGILFAGAAYVPIDASLPAARRALLFEQAGTRVAVTQLELARQFDWPSHITRVVVADEPRLEPASGAYLRQRPHDLAYVIFTSGTTGTPKGVMIEHAAAKNTITDINRRLELDCRDRVFGVSSLSFDLSVYDVFGTLAAGAALVLPGATKTKEPPHWRELIERFGVTVWNSVPAIALLLEESTRLAGRGFGPLRVVLMSGDWIPLSLPDALRQISPELRLLSLGGATEASIWSNIFEIGEVAADWSSVPYGRALTQQSMHVLDEALDVTPPLVPGSIYIGGAGVARGYLGDPKRTDAAFIRHPVTGERLYRTGDLGKYRSDGEIELLGREDHQVKIQGYRVECSEVEAALFASGDFSAAVVTAVGDEKGAKRLVAYGTPATERRPEQEVLDRLRQALPAYMVPSTIVWVDSLPLTANGKVDRSRLPAPSRASVRSQARARGPRDDLERRLGALWEEVLGSPLTGIDDDFFDCGGTSFAGMRLMARIEAEFARRLTLSTFIQHPTLSQLAVQLRDSSNHDPVGVQALVKLRDGSAQRALFCVHPVGGSVVCYRELARRLPTGTCTYGIQAPGVHGGANRRDVESIASAYLQELRRECPAGPYRLCGWSFGGVVAYELARQLLAAGESVALLALIDAPFPMNEGEPAHSEPELMTRFLNDILAVAGKATRLAPDTLDHPTAQKRAVRALALLAAEGLSVFGSPLQLLGSFETFAAHMRALAAYRPGIYPGPVTHFRAVRARGSEVRAPDWDSVAPRIRTVDLDTDHYAIVTGEPLVGIARSLSESLG